MGQSPFNLAPIETKDEDFDALPCSIDRLNQWDHTIGRLHD
jgi:hypothetical protein